ncbi:MAG: hypothetical protein QW057_00965 [Candidatus Bathyarchaeia archaeon]
MTESVSESDGAEARWRAAVDYLWEAVHWLRVACRDHVQALVRAEVLDLLLLEGKPMRWAQISRALRLPMGFSPDLEEVLAQLVEEGRLVKRGGRYRLPPTASEGVLPRDAI